MYVRQIICDNCGRRGGESAIERAHLIRRVLVARGWYHRSTGGVDLCPRCRPTTRKKK